MLYISHDNISKINMKVSYSNAVGLSTFMLNIVQAAGFPAGPFGGGGETPPKKSVTPPPKIFTDFIFYP